ncbi:MAG: DUF177 domain-containing protein [Clostridiales bacterium]|jgi:uncharacterized protein|nr:DUF177 domain-containing protein [Clostridiales bacterium]
MLLKLNRIFNTEGAEKNFDYLLDFSKSDLAEFLPFTEPVRVYGKVKNTADVVRLKGGATGPTFQFCDRCACDIKGKMNTPIEHVLVTQLEDEENDELVLLENYILDLDTLVTEDILLAMPTKLLCFDECKGLCDGCGKNLNHEKCICEKTIDPRLDVLRQLLNNQ